MPDGKEQAQHCMGKKLIVGSEVGGRTQYLAKVQGMPDEIRDRLVKIVRAFMWDDGAPRVALERLYLPVEEGGVGLLDLPARLVAIELTWVKEYLNLSPTRPSWAFVADAIIAMQPQPAGKPIKSWAKLNVFLQSWNPSGRSPLPKEIKSMLTLAKKYDTHFQALKPSTKTLHDLPIWFHFGSKGRYARLYNSPQSECLWTKHGVVTVGDVTKNLTSGQADERAHVGSAACTCIGCEDVREAFGCEHPHSCRATLQKLLGTLHERWNPKYMFPADGLTPTPRRIARNAKAMTDGGPIIFNPSVLEQDGDLGSPFRIFTDPDTFGNTMVVRPWPRQQGPQVVAYTDGSCIKNGSHDAVAGAGVFFESNRRPAISIRLPETLRQSNQTGELAAVLAAVQAAPPFSPLLIKTDSQYVVKGITSHLKKWEDRGWLGVDNRALLEPIAARLRLRGAQTAFEWVKGHSGVEGNEEADRRAGKGAEKPAPDLLDLSVPRLFKVSGARLATMSQKIAYLGVRSRKTKPVLPERTIENLAVARLAAAETFGVSPTDAMLWKSVRHRDITRKIRDFLWKVMHSAYMVGSYWRNIPGYHHRERCDYCGEEESMGHILTECRAPGQSQLWGLTRELWVKKHPTWSHPTLGVVLACAAAAFSSEEGKPLSGANRLFRILMTETAYMIWSVRCERVIGWENARTHTIEELSGRWRRVINQRLTLDQVMTRTSLAKTSIPPKVVLATWRSTLNDEEALPDNWIGAAGVLVGVG